MPSVIRDDPYPGYNFQIVVEGVSDDGSSVAKGAEVVVTRYDRGIAYVRLWSEMSGELDEAGTRERSE